MEETTTEGIDQEERPLETSPQGRYVRFGQRLGSGAYKTVFKAYDTDQGIDVAWNAIDIASLPSGEKSRIIQEVQLLQKLEHKNIINFYGSWFSKEKNQVVFITEIMTSGTLKSYIKRVQFVKWKIIKRWSLQILEGLAYLHRQNPPVIHRDLKCDNIFINGNTGDLRIGDLGLSTQMAVEQRAQSVLGTPEFMAPELYDENYDEKVDIYAFGMCVLEMVTKEVPYSECMNPAQIYKKVIAGIRPQGLQRIISESAKSFIELCLSRGDGTVDVTAAYLMEHRFLQASDNDDVHQLVHELEVEDVSVASEPDTTSEFMSKELNMESSTSCTFAAKEPVVRRKSVPNMLVEVDVASKGANTAFELNPNGNTDGLRVHSNGLEPVTGETSGDNEADVILASMPGNESEVQNERVHIMAGRGQRLNTSMENDSDEKKIIQVARSMTTGPPKEMQTTVRPHSSSVPDLETMQPRPRIPRDEASGRDGKREVSMEGVPQDDTLRKRGNKHDIKASIDPDNVHSILLNLRIMIGGKSKEIKFTFNLFTDAPHEVISELAMDVGIPETHITNIVDSISYLVTEGKIKNLPKMDFDVWEDAPEPYSFSVKQVKSTIPLASKPMDDKKTSRTSSAASDTLDNTREESAVIAATALLDGVGIARGNPPTGRTSKTSSISGSPPNGTLRNENKDRNLEGRLQIAQSAFDQRELSLEAAIRNEQEKHQREMNRYRKKMEEFERKKHKAAHARQARLEQVEAEFKAESVVRRKSGTFVQQVAKDLRKDTIEDIDSSRPNPPNLPSSTK